MSSFTAKRFWRSMGALMLFPVLLSAGAIPIIAHGGEDHGDTQPKTVASAPGTISHTQRLGEIEVMVKHPLLEPDTATTGRIFVTSFATNEPVQNAEISVQVESSNGSMTEASVEKTESAGAFLLKVPALPEGSYTLRTNIKYKGETDTATFSGVRVEHPAAEASVAGGMPWLQIALIFSIGAVLLALFSSLVFFVWRLADEKQVQPVHEETVAA